MRIALFTETYLPHVNGVVTHIKSLKDGLERLGHEVLVVTADSDARRHYISDGVLHCPAHASKRLYGYGIATPISSTRVKYIRQFRPDIIHVHQEFGIGFSGMAIAKMYGITLVYTLHTMYDEYIYYISPPSLAPMTNKMSHKYIKLFAKSAQALTGPSKKCEEYFHKVGVYKPVSVIPNPVDLELFDPSKTAAKDVKKVRAELGVDENTLVGLFVGRLGREKSVDVLLKYWHQSIAADENIRLVILGEGPCKDELENQSRELGIDNMVTFLGKISHEKVPPYIAACDFYITASTSDTDSISMLEGMAMGLPVFQITDPINEGQVCDGVNGFVFSSPQEMAYEIRLLKNMPGPSLQALRDSARQSVENSGSIDLARYVLKVYSGALRANDRKHTLLKITKQRTMRTLRKLRPHKKGESDQ